ncbi:metallophosphoesterase [Gracilibacillus sp. YIM 98692]|uniref:metallophosphoesterase n=1 Tax=Gracilibacillus sp. YIM 98692 TaxID=2663532 RepID=UPI0013D4AC70|nr:metallophosphoesterase [Gracilibacillus sp. YIM 98692]
MSIHDKEFSIVIIPDTQVLPWKQPSIYQNLTKWIKDHAEELNLQMVLHVGDVVDTGERDEAQFKVAEKAFEEIYNTNIPMLMAVGNHDYDNLLAEDRSLKMFNKYFGLHRYENCPWFGGTFEEGQIENSYATLDIGGRSFLFLSLEFGPRDDVLRWADEILTKYSNHTAIIISHCYMYMYGERTKEGDQHNPKDYPGATGANDGEDMWQKSFKKHSNLLAVFSGHHITENVSYRMDVGDNGNQVFQSFQNWQYAENGGEGRIRILKIRPSDNEMNLCVFNTHTGEYEGNDGYRVTVPFKTTTSRLRIMKEV